MGFFKIDRDFMTSQFWLSEPFTKPQAWIDLIGMANFADKTSYYKGEFQEIKRGQIATSVQYLAERWKWGRHKVWNYLRTLEGNGMVTTQGTAKGTLLTIVNYAFYQDAGNAKGTQRERKGNAFGNAQETLRDTKEEIKKEKKVNRGGTLPPTREDVASYISENGLQVDADRFVDYYEAIGWELNGRPIKSWQALCRRWSGTEDYDKQEKKQTDEERRAEVRRLLEISERGGNIYDTSGS